MACQPTGAKNPPASCGRGIFDSIGFGLAEVALQQALESLAVTGLVAGQAVRLRRPAAQ